MNLTKNKKKQIEGIDFKKLYKISDAVKICLLYTSDAADES